MVGHSKKTLENEEFSRRLAHDDRKHEKSMKKFERKFNENIHFLRNNTHT